MEPRNTPTVINAAFNFANFWDGRANNIFNGVSPFGPADANARVFENNGVASGPLSAAIVRLENSSLASQAVGPPTSDFEMSARGRTWPKIGKKMLSLPPLAKQAVHPQDSVLGALANGCPLTKGLNTTYTAMIQAAFQPQYWSNTTQHLEFVNPADPSLGLQIVAGPATPGNTNQFTQMEANFSLFFGLAVQLYEATLVSGETPFDAFLENAGNLTTQQAQRPGDSSRRWVAPVATFCPRLLPGPLQPLINAGALAGFPPLFLPPAGAIELMNTADRLVAFYDVGLEQYRGYPYSKRPGPVWDRTFYHQPPVNRRPVSPGLQPSQHVVAGWQATAEPITAPPTGIPASYMPVSFHALPIGNTQPPDRIGNHGAFKVPQLRNVELTGPYMHNGGMATLRQVVDFYTRGGNFDL